MEVLKHSQKNNFDRLPDDIVLIIFNKLREAKWLCRCSIVSKRFTSLIPHISNVSVKAPNNLSTWFEQKEGRTSVFDYLVGLKAIVHLHIEDSFFWEVNWEPLWFPLLKWKIVEFNVNVKSFTFLMASLLKVELLPEDEKQDDEEEDEEEDEEDIQNARSNEQLQQLNIALRCFDDACMKLNIVLDMIEKHQMLQSITLTDVMKQGKIVVSGNRIAELRDLERAKLSMPKMDSGGVNFLVKCCHLLLLQLPKSEFLMERPTLVYVRCVNPSCDDEGDDVIDDEMLAGSFDGDEGGVFSEAVKEILANHKNKMDTGRVP
ncbi:F-box protein AUF2 isoform X2 [Rhododendron vialii]|uniref:F-box protein AUF2 isoform X2 n=1 Tax=Rhododendron vialii TaxID=182163 RepID=UPI00265D71D9|nr:F-box protein AUF2 isoform X2 [Rhododendron vialii]XP_058199162.1 F-box protein AUF2 isoform X2 [Rhododendron vialii]